MGTKKIFNMVVLLGAISFSQIEHCPSEIPINELHDFLRNWKFCRITYHDTLTCDSIIPKKIKQVYIDLLDTENLDGVNIKSYKTNDSLLFFFPTFLGGLPGATGFSTNFVSMTYCLDSSGFVQVKHTEVLTREERNKIYDSLRKKPKKNVK